MQLPNDSIGPTDVMAYRECPRRMSYGMRRHVAQGKQNQRATMPEADEAGAVWSRAYGSAIHEAIAELEQGNGVGRAIQAAWNKHGHHLNPADLDLLHADLETYKSRDFPNTRTVLAEDELRVFLMEHRGKRIYMRTRVDRLYERLDAPGKFVHVDYKSSRHAKSEGEVRDDLQLWISNWMLHEHFPEIDELLQVYDQLRFGQVFTRKTQDAREKIRRFLIAQVTAILEDEDRADDGLLQPKKNQWCAWCPIMESCPIVVDLLDFAKMEIAALAPAEKRGRKTVVELDPGLMPEYLYRFENAQEAVKILERFVDAVRRVLKDMPQEEREKLGWQLKDRSTTVFTPQALEALHEQLGERFFEVAKLTKTGLESALADEPDLLAYALGLGEKQFGSSILLKA